MGAHPFNTISQILYQSPIGIEYAKKVSLPWEGIKKFAGIYIDEDNDAKQHEITFLDGHLIYNTKAIKWVMRFFPVSENQFKAIRQGESDGELRFSTLENGNIKLKMLQFQIWRHHFIKDIFAINDINLITYILLILFTGLTKSMLYHIRRLVMTTERLL